MSQAGPVAGLKVALVVVVSCPAFDVITGVELDLVLSGAGESASHIKEKVGSDREAAKFCGADGMRVSHVGYRDRNGCGRNSIDTVANFHGEGVG